MLPLLILYTRLITAAIVGQAFQLMLKNKTNQDKLKLVSSEHSLLQLIKDERKQIFGTFLTITAIFLVIGDAVNPDHMKLVDEPIRFFFGLIEVTRKMVYTGLLTALFIVAGYMGMDAALRFFSATNNKLNKILADSAPGTKE